MIDIAYREYRHKLIEKICPPKSGLTSWYFLYASDGGFFIGAYTMRTRKVRYTSEEYRDYLKSKRWRSFRATIMDTCPACYRKGCDRAAKELHHVKYRKDIESTRATDVIPLCHQCHKIIHQAISLGFLKHPGNVGDWELSFHVNKAANVDESAVLTALKLQSKKIFMSENLIAEIKKCDPVLWPRIKGILNTLSIEDIDGLKFKVEKINHVKRLLSFCSTEEGLSRYQKSWKRVNQNKEYYRHRNKNHRFLIMK